MRDRLRFGANPYLALNEMQGERLYRQGDRAQAQLVGGIDSFRQGMSELEQQRRNKRDFDEQQRQYDEQQALREERNLRDRETHTALAKERNALAKQREEAADLKRAQLVVQGMDPSTVIDKTTDVKPPQNIGMDPDKVDPKPSGAGYQAMDPLEVTARGGDLGAFTSRDPSRVDARVEELFGGLGQEIAAAGQQAQPPGSAGPDQFAGARPFIERYRQAFPERGHLTDAELAGVYGQHMRGLDKTQDPLLSAKEDKYLSEAEENRARASYWKRRGRGGRGRGGAAGLTPEQKEMLASARKKAEIGARVIGAMRSSFRSAQSTIQRLLGGIQANRAKMERVYNADEKAALAEAITEAEEQVRTQRAYVNKLRRIIEEKGDPGVILMQETQEILGNNPMPEPGAGMSELDKLQQQVTGPGPKTWMMDPLQRMQADLAGAGVTPPQEPGMTEPMVTVTNGQETLQIPARRLQEALTDGFTVVGG